ncbi:uncharacterized protein FFB20_00558 [Fusarium fujikuroi]|nr:uncharacterized protein FFB20_00558 [Fusarium fujikuroi]SCN73031.1 uncharacterized protein FFE2_02728 [Fusarium fujikuroi]SCO04369.1 uncharacterized protein FFC1_09607 [Fusarium fujikuroi]SCO35863.1 uncharacterized protein FFNC_04879 [Fusarium fujikuroi]SCO36819.1 uncharacterized protein FFMR_04313 [Fusarium fujikuroi]
MPSSGLGPWGGENLKPTLVDGRRHDGTEEVVQHVHTGESTTNGNGVNR